MLSNFALSAEKEDKKKSDKYLLKILGLCEKKKKTKNLQIPPLKQEWYWVLKH